MLVLACVRARACVRVCVRACVRACVYVCTCMSERQTDRQTECQTEAHKQGKSVENHELIKNTEYIEHNDTSISTIH